MFFTKLMLFELMLLVVLAIFLAPITAQAELVSHEAKVYKNKWCQFVAKSVSGARISALKGESQEKALKDMQSEKPGLSASKEGGVLVKNMVVFAYTKGGFEEAGAACMDEDPDLVPRSVRDEINKKEKKARQQLSRR